MHRIKEPQITDHGSSSEQSILINGHRLRIRSKGAAESWVTSANARTRFYQQLHTGRCRSIPYCNMTLLEVCEIRAERRDKGIERQEAERVSSQMSTHLEQIS